MTDKQELVERVIRKNAEFGELFKEHQALEMELEEFNKLRFLTSDQEVKRKTLQKEKLRKKDRMALILREYQQED